MVAGALAGGGGQKQAPTVAPPPSLAVGDPRAPLIGPPLPPRILFVNNFQVPSAGVLQVELRALGVAAVQVSAVRLAVDQTSSTIGFFEQHAEILQLVADPTAADIGATLVLLVDGQQIGSAIPFTLLRQRVATLAPQAGGVPNAFVSVLGTSRLSVRISGRDDEQRLDDVQLEMGVPGGTVQLGSGIQAGRIPGSTDWLVSGIVLPNTHPSSLFVRVRDAVAGQSTLVTNVYYHPEILAVAPRYGATDGTTLTTLLGQGLAPLSDPADPSSPPDLGKVRVHFDKGGRTLTVPGSQIRASQSSLRQLVFAGPQSPDGRPGPATVSLEVDLGVVTVSDTLTNAFVFRRQSPSFGPRGAWLPAAPRQVRLLATSFGSGGIQDVAALGTIGGIPSVELLRTEHNGMLSSFGPPLGGGDPSDPRQRVPIGMCDGDFDRDGDQDLLIANAGSVSGGTHTVLVGQPGPAVPLQLSPARVFDVGGAEVLCGGDFDRDGIDDVLILPDQSSGTAPRVLLARPVQGQPGFVLAPLGGALAAGAPWDAGTVADLDGDGQLDVAVARGGTAMTLAIAYGDGAGGIAADTTLTMLVPGYAPDPSARVVAVASVPAAPRALVVVLAGLDASTATPPGVVVLQPSGFRVYAQPRPEDTVLLPGAKPLVAAACGDLDNQGTPELVVAGADGASPGLRVFAFAGGAFAEVVGAAPDPLEALTAVDGLVIGALVPAGPRQPQPVQGVLVRHEVQTVNGHEHRISAWLAAQGGRLVPPDASLRLGQPVLGCTLGRFTAASAGVAPPAETRDLCLVHPGSVALYGNDGVGGQSVLQTVAVAGIVPTTLVAAPLNGPGRSGDAAVWLRQDGQIEVWWPGDPAPSASLRDLRTYASTGAHDWDIAATSRVMGADVDGDAILDLAVVLVLAEPGGLGRETVALLLRGHGSSGFPVYMPDVSVPAVSLGLEATGAFVADFVRPPGSSARELALAFPTADTSASGNHVAFYRHDAGTASPTDDRFVPSFTDPTRSVLIAGDMPTQIAASDLDGNGAEDLIVASDGEHELRVFLNSGSFDPAQPLEVDIAAFQESQSRVALAPGTPMALLLGDLDGDAVADVVAITRDLLPQRDWTVACYQSSGTGTLASLRQLLHVRTGNHVVVNGVPVVRDAELAPALADVNGDAYPDLVLGWDSTGDRNVHVLFGSAR